MNKSRFKNSKQTQKNNSKINHKNNNHNNNHNNNNNAIIDDTDKKIIELLVAHNDNASISKKLDVPLTTIQRRTRKLFEKGLVSTKIELNYDKLGYKRGLLHIYLQKGLMDKIGKNVVEKRGMLSVSVHVGNSDLVALFAYRDSKDLLETIGEIKEIEGVERVLWSEEVYCIISSQPNKLYL
jgi:Lrp/AsnC family transcriptional regulator, regulator for asnA, asnC and gidA